MSEYAIFWALRHHRDIDKYAESQRAKQWKPLDFVDTIHRRVGVMGLGTIGQDAARKFAALGFPTAGWSRTAGDRDVLEERGQGLGNCRVLRHADTSDCPARAGNAEFVRDGGASRVLGRAGVDHGRARSW